MKKYLKKLFGKVVENDRLWALFDLSVNRIAEYATIQRGVLLEDKTKVLSAQRGVLEGPFAGIRYGTQAFGSRLWPKWLRTYGTELQAILQRIIQSPLIVS